MLLYTCTEHLQCSSELEATDLQKAVEYLGGLDILVPNHVMANRMQPWRSSPEDLERLKTMMDVNFMSYIYLVTHAMPHLERSTSGGRIVVLSSVTGKPFLNSVYFVEGHGS